MKFTELKESVANGAKSVYLLEGDDAYFRKKGEEIILSAFLQTPELNFTAFEGESLKGQAVLTLVNALKNFPFMSDKRIVKVTGFYPAESEYENYLRPLFEDFPETSILLIVNDGGKKGVELKRKQIVTFVDCNRADEETVAKWAYLPFRRAGITAPVSACEKIAAYCLCNMARVSVEVQKLIDYKGSGALTDEDVEELVFKDADYRLYELTNAISRRDYTLFCEIESELVKKSGDENYLLSGILNYFKNLLTILSSGESFSALSTALKMKEFAVKKSFEQAKSIGEDRLAELVSYTYSRIAEIKSGQTTPQSALLCVKNAIFFQR